MARDIGIRKNTRQCIISGARVAYDPRSTQEANDTRDPKNYKADERPMRKWLWERRQRKGSSAQDGQGAFPLRRMERLTWTSP